ncbi:MAG: LysM peptidoglycan-binding domain-containing protein [Thiomicrospira sp.]
MTKTKHCAYLRLSLLSLALSLGGCQMSGNTKPDEDNQPIAKSTMLIPDDPAVDRAEAEFEHSILTQTERRKRTTKSPIPSQPRDDVWDELADSFSLIDAHKSEYQDYLTFYLNNTRHLERASIRAKPYLHFIMQEVRRRNMPTEIALLPIVESAFYPYALSRMQAAGLWQFIPSTGRIYGLKQDWWFDGRQDVYLSTMAALDFLQSLYELNNQDWFLALASYNAGYGRIQQATARLKREDADAEVNYWSIRPYLPRETRHYVPQLLAVSYLIKHREKYELSIESIPNEPYLTRIELDRQIDLNKIADSIDLKPELIKHLNPGYLKSVTPPDGPHNVMIPITHQAAFEQALAQNDDLFNIRWQRHTIARGDTLGGIAHRYKTNIAQIRQLNSLRGNTIRAGQTLLIPVPAKADLPAKTQLASQTKAPTAATQPTQVANNTARVHQVKAGESLWTIANYYQVQTDDLAAWNNISPRSTLRIGQKLNIRNAQYGHNLQHAVAEGESLWLIARRYQVSVNDLARWNQLQTNATLQPGTTLSIWRPGKESQYTVRRGDTLWDIARAFNVKHQRLKDYNKLSRNQHLMPGQVLRIPNDS